MQLIFEALAELIFEPIDDRHGRAAAVLAVLVLIASPIFAVSGLIIVFG